MLLSLSLVVCMLSRRLRSFAPEPVKDVVQSGPVGSNGLPRRTSALLGVRLEVDFANIPAAFNTSCIGACPFVVCIRCAYVQVNLEKKEKKISRKYH
jgi:hypothetical protein